MFYWATFLANAAILIFEITGTRLMAPYLGTSIEVWAGTIAVVLGGMALGYWGGGIVADRYPSERVLQRTFLLAGVCALLAWSLRDVVPALTAGSPLPLTFAAALCACLLFAPTVAVLAAVSPFSAKFLVTTLAGSAQTVGRISAVATLGSIAGALASSSLLIPLLGIDTILIGTAVALIAFSLVLSQWKAALKVPALAVVSLLGVGLMRAPALAEGLLADVATAYNRIWVMERQGAAGRTRELHIDPFGMQCGMMLRDDGSLDERRLVSAPLQAFDLAARHFYGSDAPLRALFLGGCNYSLPRAFLLSRPSASAVAVEIDPGMTQVAEQYFGLVAAKYPTLDIVHRDARRLLAVSTEKYGVIFMDTFGSSANIPHHLSTREAFALLGSALSEGGVLLVNLVGAAAGPASEFASSLLHTAQTELAHVALYQLGSRWAAVVQNLILVASNTRELPATIADAADSSLVLKRVLGSQLAEATVLSDRYAPVESMTHALNARRAVR